MKPPPTHHTMPFLLATRAPATRAVASPALATRAPATRALAARALATGALAIAALAACAGPAADSPGATAPSAAPRSSADAPPLDPSFGARPRAGSTEGPSTTLSPGQGLPDAVDCGTFDLGKRDTLPGDAARCFVDAAQAGHPARLAVTRLSVEGDPIPVTYTAGADGHTRVVTDHRQDNFGSKNITQQTCQGPSPTAHAIAFARCTQPVPTGG
ncbi:hypothetical protein [Paractinoplanes maris]|uniref:hypothetical protein n=1 Tax=Paractinoplanes maris TaxID=1734446 RepID=UPI002020E781|nr:hypothetical protein [Actinoplanes maris]